MPSAHVIVGKKDADTLIIEGRCPGTGKKWTLEVPERGYLNWSSGMVIQKALPGLDKDQRELLISGYTNEGWEQLFGKEE
jgi:hypothetical protein